MSAEAKISSTSKRLSNRVIVLACLTFFGGMLGMSFAAVPLYQLFCQVTGYGGTTQRVEQYSDTILDRRITVRFDANVSGGLPWDFAPERRAVEIRIGETAEVAYKAQNLVPRPTSGHASFNVSPPMAGAYFNKVECFCFTDTELKPGESLGMPVVFFVDPAIVNVPELKNLKTITLSYTFFPLAEGEPVAASGQGSAGTARTNAKLGG
jgi:cytochrome c oxidase assembly protein subunit 11